MDGPGTRVGSGLARLALLLLATCQLLAPEPADAQYFGRNKPVYRNIRFEILQTPHLDLYHYFHDSDVARALSDQGEAWYAHHRKIFGDTIGGRNPVLIYQNAGDFQQTNTVFSEVGVGTGGVTEALKNRVVLPVTHSFQETSHVLGHELVHAFQFDAVKSSDSLHLSNLQHVPLWMIEGMAEYLSLGIYHPPTTLWMRDAVVQDRFPDIKALGRDPHIYFPYRFGHSLLAYVGQCWGDSILVPWLRATAHLGLEDGTARVLGVGPDTLSILWREASLRHYGEHIQRLGPARIPGVQAIGPENGGLMNISPAVSPDGRFLAFFCERNRVELELFVADLASGRILRSLYSSVQSSTIDALNFIESGGTWSPDGRYFAIVAFARGRNSLVLLEVETGRVAQRITPEGVPSFRDPTWSPDGQRIAISGLVEGKSDLYEIELQTGSVTQLTHDLAAQIQPTYSPDGNLLLHATDAQALARGETGYDLAEFDLNTRQTHLLPTFDGASNLCPRYAPHDNRVYFLSDADGFRNLYALVPSSGSIFRLSTLPTGITGITPHSPALSLSADGEVIAYTLFSRGGYQIYRASPADFLAHRVEGFEARPQAGLIAPGCYDSTAISLVRPPEARPGGWNGEGIPRAYRPLFGLDYIANAGVGVGTGAFGTGMAGGIDLIFSDITGGNTLYTGLALNGEVWDFGGQVTYINRDFPLQWALGISHVPYSTGYMDRTNGSEMGAEGKSVTYDSVSLFHLRNYQTSASGMLIYPFSQSLRLEGGASWSWYGFRLEQHTSVYEEGRLTSYNREKLASPPSFALTRAYGALVYDNSHFGFASPWRGTRARVEVEKVWGQLDYVGTLIDLRRYWFHWPVGIAVRGLFNARWGIRRAYSYLYPFFLGYPWFVRGYGWDALFKHYSPGDHVLTINQLMGSHLAVMNAEIRLPLIGPERAALIPLRYLPTELTVFADAGLVWYDWKNVALRWQPRSTTERSPLVSLGVSLRINILGMLILEPYYAMPLQMGGIRSAYIGLNLAPGW